MNNLLTAIYGKFSGSSLSSNVGGRIFFDSAPEGTEYPYVVYFINNSVQNKTFTEIYSDTTVQFNLFSISTGVTEITTMYNNLKSLFDECSLTITGSTLIWMREGVLSTSYEDIVTENGTVGCRNWAVDYDVLTSLN